MSKLPTDFVTVADQASRLIDAQRDVIIAAREVVSDAQGGEDIRASIANLALVLEDFDADWTAGS